MTTLLKLGPADHDLAMSREEFETAYYQEGYRYELIRGKLYVSPAPNPLHEAMVNWLGNQMETYVRARLSNVNRVSWHPRVFVPGEDEQTSPEPDLAVYQDYPFHIPKRRRDWRQIHPVLVVEVISEDDPDKDLVRNVALYLQAPTIREYWILDPREDADYPELLVYRRRGRRWQRPIRLSGGGTYTTKLLPAFTLVLDASEA